MTIRQINVQNPWLFHLLWWRQFLLLWRGYARDALFQNTAINSLQTIGISNAISWMGNSNYFEAVLALVIATDNLTGEQPQTSDEDLMVQFILQNKVLHTCALELIYRGFSNLYALTLAEPNNLQGLEIPTGQQRLISHLKKVLWNQSQSDSKAYDRFSSSCNTAWPSTWSANTHWPVRCPYCE